MSAVAGIIEAEANYTFDLRDRFSWHNYATPAHDPAIRAAIERVGDPITYQTVDYPRYRAVWGGEERVYVEQVGDWPAGMYLKYQLCIVPDYRNPANLLDTRNHTGYQWRKEDTGFVYRDPLTGQTRHVLLEESVPAQIRLRGEYEDAWHYCKELSQVPGDAILVFPILREPEEIGLPRWCLERFHLPHESELGLASYYLECFWQGDVIDPFLGFGDYRPLDERAVEFVEGLWHFQQKSPDEKRAWILQQKTKEAEAAKRRDEELWDQRKLDEESAIALEQVEHILRVATSEEDAMLRIRKQLEKNFEQDN
jgi:hypothetical protein